MPQPRITTRFQFDDAKGEPIAHVTLDHRPGGLWLTDLWTHADHRRQSHAKRLLTDALALFPGRTVYLEVYPYTDQPLDRPALAALYTGFGFVDTPVPGVMVRWAAQITQQGNGILNTTP